jgi:arabinofuranan 3-O-arabinosyltransferase
MYWFMGKDSPRWDEVGPAVGLPVAADGILPNPFAAAALLQVSRERTTPGLADAVTAPAVGGPLYPPIHAFFYAPLGLDPSPRRAYRTFQIVSVGLTFLAGLGVSRISRGRIWWPAATLAILLYPGYRSGLDLAQNHVLSLAIVVWGWALAARGRDGLGGMVWGLLAFKPVWAAAFFLAPLLMGRWRFCAAMVATGAGLAVATLPVVGIQGWLDWWHVGREAADLYQVNRNWTFLGRDLAGIARRGLIDFDLPEAERNSLAADVAGWSVWAAVFVPTVGLYLWRGDKRYRTGLGAGFLFLGAYLCCYRFMYYDALLSALPLAVLFADPGRFVRPTPVVVRAPVRWEGVVNSAPLTLLVVLYLVENWVVHLGLEGTARLGFLGSPEDAGKRPPSVSGEISPYYPTDTFVLLGIWAWAGVRLLIGGDWGEPSLRSDAAKGVQGGPDVR